MKLIKRFLAICSFTILTFAVSAQDIHFSQFYLSPLHLNPALTGIMNCNVRIVGNYRNQWASVLKTNAYNTYSVSYDQKFAVGRYDYFGVGASFWGDKAGQLDFSTLQAKVSASYSKRMGGGRRDAHYLVIGAEAGLTQRSLDLQAARWGTQHNGLGEFDETAPSFETTFDRDNFIYPDVSAGLLWFSVFDDENNLFVGGAYSHLNRANQSFDSDSFEPLYSKFTFHAGGEFRLASKLGLIPGVITLFQGPSFELNAGTSFKFILNKRTDNAFQAGAWVRLSNHVSKSVTADALILSTRFDYESFSIGFSYDINISSLRPASNANGAFEFALIYQICGPEKRNVYCPNF